MIRIECTVPANSGWTSKGGRGNELIVKTVREKDRQLSTAQEKRSKGKSGREECCMLC